MWIDFAFVFFGFIADMLLRMMIPIDTSLQSLVFIPHIGFLTFLLVALKKPMMLALSSALILGLIVDLLSREVLGNVIAYPITIYVIKVWSNQFNESLFEQVFVGTIALFIKEFIFYICLFILGFTHLELSAWFVKREFLTLIGHVPLLLGLCLMHRTKNRIQDTQDRHRQGRERVLTQPTLKP